TNPTRAARATISAAARWRHLVDTWAELAVTANGGLAGPFNAFVTAHDAGRRLPALGATLRSAET
ncbi:MAG: hypothetical protein ACRDNO_27955, partial [Trebonia sp.]